MTFKASQSIYTYKATIVRVIDADTCESVIDLGFKIEWRTIVRFVDFDAYEVRGANAHPRGKLASSALTDLLRDHAPGGLCYLRTDRDEIAIYNRVAGWAYLQGATGFIDVTATLRARGWDKRDEAAFDSFDPKALVVIQAADISEVPDPRLRLIR